MWYGLSEVVVATASTWYLVSQLVTEGTASGVEEWIGVAGSIYIFSRGLGNAAEGYEERHKLQPNVSTRDEHAQLQI
jgi:hypothetical protein